MYLWAGIERIEKLDAKRRAFLREADAISNMQPLGQPWPTYERALNNAEKICRKQAGIWNKIRNIIIRVSDKEITLWQLALKEGLPVKDFGDEGAINFFGSDIRKMVEKFSEEV